MREGLERSHWQGALQYLSRFDDAQTLNLFWELALRDDVTQREVVWLVNLYLEKHQDRYGD